MLVALCACKPVPVAAPHDARPTTSPPHPLAMPDETMEFLAQLGGVSVGRVQTAIGRPGWIDSRHAIIVKSRAHSEGLASLVGDIQWELSTTIDLDAGEPIEDLEEAWIDVAGSHEHHREATTWDASDQRHDVHSAIALLRGWHSTPGERATVEVGLAGGHFDVSVWDAGRELLASANKPAVRYEGRAADRFPIAIWLSDDTARVPLAFRADTKIGAITVQLTSYDVVAD